MTDETGRTTLYKARFNYARKDNIEEDDKYLSGDLEDLANIQALKDSGSRLEAEEKRRKAEEKWQEKWREAKEKVRDTLRDMQINIRKYDSEGRPFGFFVLTSGRPWTGMN
ncbi:hypothetical protein EWM64_g7006 [Hericium alpestre]|uniref:Uncharacterized protein n=1 Tax=Hericium alpestre TaxID=135208 RepID=A0A4Y9ZSH5_9AGAM|nr:hypothetical protein EWM64_g7006 [Hericium alpestre]